MVRPLKEAAKQCASWRAATGRKHSIGQAADRTREPACCDGGVDREPSSESGRPIQARKLNGTTRSGFQAQTVADSAVSVVAAVSKSAGSLMVKQAPPSGRLWQAIWPP